MGTRSLTYIKEKKDTMPTINIYKQYDGYPDGWGLQLAEFLNKYTIVNGYQLNDERVVANGVACLIAQLVANFKEDVGGLYVYPISSKDCGQEYEYHISVCDKTKNITIKIIEIGWGDNPTKTIFKGSPLELINKYK